MLLFTFLMWELKLLQKKKKKEKRNSYINTHFRDGLALNVVAVYRKAKHKDSEDSHEPDT